MRIIQEIKHNLPYNGINPKFIITSRESDYTACKSHRDFETVSGSFEKIYLIDCDKEEARSCIMALAECYEEAHADKKEELKKLAAKDSFVNLMTRPVFMKFLQNMVLGQYMPKAYLRPIDILEDVIERTCYRDNTKSNVNLKASLSKIAFDMSRDNANTYELTEELKNHLQEDAVGVIHIETVRGKKTISFAHNIIREYLVAQRLFEYQHQEMRKVDKSTAYSIEKSDFYESW